MKEENTSTPEDTFVNYVPAMPKLSTEPGRFERFVRKLFRRRGGLRPVTRQEQTVVVDTSERQ